MKPLITAAEVKKAYQNQDKAIFIEPGGIITPAARDAAREHGIRIVANGKEPLTKEGEQQIQAALSQALITSIVSEVISSLNQGGQSHPVYKEVHPCGLKLVRGNSVILEDFNIDYRNGKVQLKEIFNIKESPGMVAGFMTIDKTTFSCRPRYDEINYILEGTLECAAEDNKITGKAGDVLFIPANTQITLSAVEKVKVFFVTHPGNW